MSNVNPHRFFNGNHKPPLTPAKIFRQCFINTIAEVSGDSSVIATRFHGYCDVSLESFFSCHVNRLTVSEQITSNKTKQKTIKKTSILPLQCGVMAGKQNKTKI